MSDECLACGCGQHCKGLISGCVCSCLDKKVIPIKIENGKTVVDVAEFERRNRK